MSPIPRVVAGLVAGLALSGPAPAAVAEHCDDRPRPQLEVLNHEVDWICLP